MYFASDNGAGAAQPIVDAIVREAARFGKAYGESPLDQAVEARFSEIFERNVAVLFVATGTAANALALASVNKPGGAVFCHRESHIAEDECGAVEFFTGGARLFLIDGAAGKIDPGGLSAAIGRFTPGVVHSGQPMALSVSQLTEAGGIYTIQELRELTDIARRHRLPVHMDGARFANALVHLGVSPAEATWKSGVDILSFGGTKNGCIGAEAVVVFDPERARELPYLRKRAGHLFSKSRFVAAQFEAYLRDDLWLELARHANAMAKRLREGICASGRAQEAWPTDGNETFVVIKEGDVARLRAAGAVFYDWTPPHCAGLLLQKDEMLIRLVTSFATTADQVDEFIAKLGA